MSSLDRGWVCGISTWTLPGCFCTNRVDEVAVSAGLVLSDVRRTLLWQVRAYERAQT